MSNVAELSSETHRPQHNEILKLSFNQDYTALAMGTLTNYGLFTISAENKLEEIHNCDIQAINGRPYLPYEEVIIIERLFSSSLVALVTRQQPRKLRVCHFRRGSEICAYSFSGDIRNLKLNRLRLIVCLEENIYIHNMKDMKLTHTLAEVPSNPEGLCALSANDENPYLAYPASTINGAIQIFHTIHLKPILTISAHENPLVAMVFDVKGSRIASASDRGTVIRVHNVVDGVRLFEFRRGVQPATIYSLAFSPDSMFLAASSNTATIHIFRMIDPKQKSAEETTAMESAFGFMMRNITYILPTHTAEVLSQDRSFATVHFQQINRKTIVGMNTFDQILKLFVAGYDGTVHIYEVNTVQGGECTAVCQYDLLKSFRRLNQPSDQSPEMSLERQPTPNEPRPSNYPPNILRANEQIQVLSTALINNKHLVDQSYKTALDGENFPKLSSPPSSVDD